jgi:hypothetical protein
VFGLLFAGVIVATFFTVPIPNLTGDLILVCFALTFVAALAIGVRFPSWSWAAGPPAAILITVLTILLFPDPDAAQRSALGESTQKEQFVFMLVGGGAFSLILLACGYALLAAAGVRVGQRRAAPPTATPGAGSLTLRQHRRYAVVAPHLAMAGATGVQGGFATRSRYRTAAYVPPDPARLSWP